MKQMVLALLLCLSYAGAQGLRETASAWVDHYARAYGVPAEFVKAVIDVESGWQTNMLGLHFSIKPASSELVHCKTKSSLKCTVRCTGCVPLDSTLQNKMF